MADGFIPPAPVRANAKRGLELREKYGRGGTAIGVARARDLSNGSAVSLDTVKRMTSYFARHEVDKKGEGWGVDSAGYIAWLLWGGDAGWAWAKKIVKENDSKEKSTVNDLTTAFFEIVKADKRDDGTLMVYGKATDDSLDIDQQICDPVWLDRAMPEWFKSGGNIREQHSSIAAGVAKEYEKKADGHYIHALVVDPISVKKVDTGVLKGFSIGIKSPRVVRDTKAVNGRIIDGQIVEVSLVDRPANPNCQLVLAKSAEGESGMWKTEELIEKEETDYEGINAGGESSEPADKELYSRVKAEAKKKFEVYPSAVANAWVTREYKKRGGTYKKKEKSAEASPLVLELLQISDDAEKRALLMKNAQELIELSKSIAPADIVKFDQKLYEDARRALAQLIVVEAGEMDSEGSNEEMSIAHLLSAVHHLFEWYQGEVREGEVLEAEDIELAAKPEDEEKSHHMKEMKPNKGETFDAFKARCKEAGMDEEFAKECYSKYTSAKEGHKSAETHKCLECGCGLPEESHGRSDVTTADIVSPEETPKSAEPTEVVSELKDQELPEAEEAAPAEEATPAEETPATEEAPAAEEEKVSEGENLAEEIEAIVEKAIKSATESLKSEIAQLANAKEAAVSKAVGLESELAVAKSLAVAGGPKRTIKPVDHSTNDLLVKAATYKAKADASTDPDLMKGYKLLAEKYFTEADAITKNN
jgi:hypothetical protein